MPKRLARFLGKRLKHPISIKRLQGGIWNDSFLVKAGKAKYAAKLYLPRPPKAFYKNSGWVEWRTLCLLEPLGIAPNPVLFAPSKLLGRALLLSEFIEGKTGALKGKRLAEAAKATASFHAIRASSKTRFLSKSDDSIPSLRRQIQARIRRLSKKLPGDNDLARFKKIFSRLPSFPCPAYSPCLLHTDLVPGNFIQGKKLALIDWQSPRFGDPACDIATFCSDAYTLWDLKKGFSEKEKQAFLRAYLNKRRDASLPARLKAKAPYFILSLGLHYLERFSDFRQGRLPKKLTSGKEKLFLKYSKVKDACLRELERNLP